MKVLKLIEKYEAFPADHVTETKTYKKTTWLGATVTREYEHSVPMSYDVRLYPRGWGKDGITWEISKSDWAEIKRRSFETPLFIGQHTRNKTGIEYFLYYFEERFYISEIKLSEDEVALIIESEDKKRRESLRREMERIKAKAEMEGGVRQPIPKDVQILVWNRDKGRCVECGSQGNLEFDHIIPISKGGSNTARNIQLLCERCNRTKSNKIGG
jgi:hypothetical protein